MPTDPDSGWIEPDILINGTPLTLAECMTVRIAISSFLMSLSTPSLQRALGPLAEAYRNHCVAIEGAMRRHE